MRGKIANLGQTSVSAKFTFRNFAEKIYLHGVKNGSAIGNFCAEKRTNFLRGSKSEFKQNQWMWRVFAIRILCVEVKANLHCVKYGSAMRILF